MRWPGPEGGSGGPERGSHFAQRKTSQALRAIEYPVSFRYAGVMSEPRTLSRSPELMSPADTALLVVDVQEKLMPLIGGSRRIIWNLRRLRDPALAA